MRDCLHFVLLLLLFTLQRGNPTYALDQPNMILILCDDLGYGDVQCYHAEGKVATPHIDRLAREGVMFTDAHSSSAVCTPTRYALLTGRYNWRSRLQRGVLGGLSPRLIEPGLMTLAGMLKSQGYTTACVGKWHLGLDWQLQAGAEAFGHGIEKGSDGWRVDFEKRFGNGPLSLGFDYYYGISASLDMVPYTFLENDRVTIVPDTDAAFPMMVGRRPDQMTRRGPAAKAFDAADVLPALTQKSLELIGDWTAATADGTASQPPFFLYLALASPHTPILPQTEWLGKSGLNPYADFVMQTDDAVGQILRRLDELQLADQTLVVFTSDNGCSPQADFPELARHGHHPSAIYRGHKADIFEGGHRVPYIARWPAGLPAGVRQDALIGLQDTMATCAEILGVELPPHAAVDSFSWWGVAGGRELSAESWPPRESLVHHSINGSFALRRGPWKLCFCADSGGWSAPRPGSQLSRDLPPLQLFDLQRDAAEAHNVAADHPQVVQELTREMAELIRRGRSTAGGPVPNTVQVSWKPPLSPESTRN